MIYAHLRLLKDWHEDEEAADDEEGDEVEVGKVGATASALGVQIVRLGVALGLWLVRAVQHDLLPAFPGGRTKEYQQSLKTGLRFSY